MRDEIDDILRKRLHDVEIYESLPSWERVEGSINAIESEKKKKKIFFLFSKVYGKAAVVLILIGLSFGSYYIFNDKSVSENPMIADEGYLLENQKETRDSVKNTESKTDDIQILDNEIDIVEEDTRDLFATNANSFKNDRESKNTTFSEEEGEIIIFETAIEDHTNNNLLIGFESFKVNPPSIGLFLVLQNKPLEIEEQFYDINSYLADFYSLYEENNDIDYGNWGFRFFSDIIAINKSSEKLNSNNKEALSVNSYHGKTYYEGDLVFLVDQKLVIDYIDDLPSMSIDYSFDRLIHKFPISFNFGVRKMIPNNWGIETGLLYTYMESYAGILKRNSIYFEQQLHYLGIPIFIFYNLYSSESAWDIELRGGLLTEKNISTTGTTSVFKDYNVIESTEYDEVPSSLMLSTNLGIGFGYKLFKDFGIYMEPSMAYYFYTKGQPLSYKTDRPLSFNLKAGIRFNF